MRFPMLLAVAMAIAGGAPALADVRVDYSGVIQQVDPGTPAAFGVGTPVTFDAVYDPSKLVDHTQGVNDATGLGFASVFDASLSDDPYASLTITVGPTSFSKFDELAYGTPRGDGGPKSDLGHGNLPALTFLDGSFAGVTNFFANSAGYSFNADPLVIPLFGGFDLGDGNGGYGIYLGQYIDGDPFANDLAVGNFDASSAVFSTVPEPSVWITLLGSLGLAIWARPRRAERDAEPLRAV